MKRLGATSCSSVAAGRQMLVHLIFYRELGDAQLDDPPTHGLGESLGKGVIPSTAELTAVPVVPW